MSVPTIYLSFSNVADPSLTTLVRKEFKALVDTKNAKIQEYQKDGNNDTIIRDSDYLIIAPPRYGFGMGKFAESHYDIGKGQDHTIRTFTAKNGHSLDQVYVAREENGKIVFRTVNRLDILQHNWIDQYGRLQCSTTTPYVLTMEETPFYKQVVSNIEANIQVPAHKRASDEAKIRVINSVTELDEYFAEFATRDVEQYTIKVSKKPTLMKAVLHSSLRRKILR